MAFQDIAGNGRVKQILKLALARDRVPNSLLFAGPDGVGKGRTALTLAKALNCLERTGDSCDRCSSCLAIDGGRFPDVMEVETAGDFEDETIPANYCPFGIQAVGDSIFVTYAVKGGEDDVAGQGHGLVREFDTNGNLVAAVADHGQLNSPWGIALAPANFGLLPCE